MGDAVPEEWFIVPLPIIREAISKFADGSIVNYIYNVEMQALEAIEVKDRERFKTGKAQVDGFDILSMSIKQIYFDAILTGDKDIEFRELKNTTMGKLTRLDKATGKRYIRQPHILRLYTSYSKDHDVMLVEVKKTVFHQPQDIEYHLGRILEYDLKMETAKRTGMIKRE